MERIVIITGASRGIGASIGIELSQKFANDRTLFLLIARNEANLEQVKCKMMEDEPEDETTNKVIILPFDFSMNFTVEYFTKIIADTLHGVAFKMVRELFVFYNHGTLKMGSLESNAQYVSEHFQVNVISVWTMLAAIRKLFTLEHTPIQFHVNLSTPLVDKVLHPFSLYSATRTSRDTIFKYLALEHPPIRVLNYQPGPVYTDMLKQVYESGAIMYNNFKEDYEGKKLIDPDTSVSLLLDIIKKNKFVNGITIDFFEFI